MDYVYLPIQSGFRIRKSTMISVLNDIIAAENGNVDMREIGAKYGLSRYERHAVEDFLYSISTKCTNHIKHLQRGYSKS